MDQATSDPFNLLVLSFTNRLRDLRGLMLLRTPDSFHTWQDSILDLNGQLLDIEKLLAMLKDRVAMEKKLIPHINEFKAMALAQQDELLYIQSHLPARLPGKFVAEPQSSVELEKAAVPVPSATNPLVEEATSTLKKLEPPKKVVTGPQPPVIPYVTVDELESTPKYMKGRLTLDKVNAAIDEVQKIVDAKYKILALPISKMNDKLLKKYKVFKDMETAETKGLFFIAEPDLVDTAHLKQGDATGKAVLSVLRHLHRLKDLGGALKRYTIVG